MKCLMILIDNKRKKKRKNDARRESEGEKNVIERDWQ